MNLDKILKKYKISQTQLARNLNITQQTMNSYTLNKSEPNIDTLCKIADYFHITLDELVGRDTRLVNLASLDDNTREAIQSILSMTSDEVDKLLNIIKIVKS